MVSNEFWGVFNRTRVFSIGDEIFLERFFLSRVVEICGKLKIRTVVLWGVFERIVSSELDQRRTIIRRNGIIRFWKKCQLTKGQFFPSK